MLAAIDCNYNVDRPKVSDCLHYSKHAKQYILRNVYKAKDYTWRQSILADIVEQAALASSTSLCQFQDFSDISIIPKRLKLEIEKPNVGNVRQKRISKFKKHS